MATLTFGANAKSDRVPEYARRVIDDILRAARCPFALATSTARTPAGQAAVMWSNLNAYGVDKQRALYAAAGDEVIEVYRTLRAKGESRERTIVAMTAKIVELGPERVSRHCADPSKLCVIDIAPSSVLSKARFEAAVRADGRVAKFLLPPLDPAYHLEIPIPEETA